MSFSDPGPFVAAAFTLVIDSRCSFSLYAFRERPGWLASARKRDLAAGGQIVRLAKLLNGLDFPCDNGSPGAR